VSRWPTVGPPPDFASAQEYDATVATLLDSGVISDAGMIYFDARLSARYPTIEIRVADACPRLDDVVLLAALARALVVTGANEDAAGLPLPESPQVLLRSATWRAARSGLDGHLVDPLTVRAVPAVELVGALLRYLRPALEDRGDWDTAAELTRALLIRGPSARSQRAAVRRGVEWSGVAAALAAQTAED
jgi:carboxylate-amine ligase